MSTPTDLTEALCERVNAALDAETPLELLGQASKRFYGREPSGDPLTLDGHTGVVGYEPTELVVTALAGTPIREVEEALAAQGQMLGFEPPRFGGAGTIGGAVASGLSGPRRPYAGSVRDFVLGTRVLNGRGEVLSFGGQVMKNVAGYDVSRVMTGALGTLGLLLEVSLKVLPGPEQELTLAFEMDEGTAVERLTEWSGHPLPLSATCHHDGRLQVRLSGTEKGVAAAAAALGGETVTGMPPWEALRDHTHPFFAGNKPLWRLSLPPATGPLGLPGGHLSEWGGAQRWVRTETDAESVRAAAEAAGGHATVFRHGPRGGDVFQPLPAGLRTLHRRLKASFDPAGIFNPGRLYEGI